MPGRRRGSGGGGEAALDDVGPVPPGGEEAPPAGLRGGRWGGPPAGHSVAESPKRLGPVAPIFVARQL